MDNTLYARIKQVVAEDFNPMADEASALPEITPELVAELVEELGVSEEQKAAFEAGLSVEIEHAESVDNDMSIIGKIVLDHINEFPGKDYYAALALMEEELAKEDEVAAEEGPAAEAPVVDEPVAAEAKVEVKTEEGKIPADPAKYDEKDRKDLMEKTEEVKK